MLKSLMLMPLSTFLPQIPISVIQAPARMAATVWMDSGATPVSAHQDSLVTTARRVSVRHEKQYYISCTKINNYLPYISA